MSSLPPLRDRRALTSEWIRRFVTYTTEVTYFGPNSTMRAVAESTAALAESANLLYVALVRRFTLMSASGLFLKEVAAERGCTALDAQPAKVLVVLEPARATITAITSGGTDLLEVDDSSSFAAGDSIRVRNADASVTETRAIIAITVGTGPSGGDELEVATLAGVYAPGVEDVAALLRVTLPAGTLIETTAGVSFETLELVTTGDANPVLDGESSFLGLADKVWCECTTRGAAGNIDPLTVTDLTTPVTGIERVYNPEPGTGGLDEESDYDLKYRTMHLPTLSSQETTAWIEALAKSGNRDVLRAVRSTSTTIGTMTIRVLHRNGGTFSGAALTQSEAFLADRVRSYLTVDVQNVTLTAIEVEARISLEPDTTLKQVFVAAASRLATFLDYRKWEFGGTVDEADLLSIVNGTTGVASLETSTFLPAASVTVDKESLPTLVRLSLQDIDSGDTINADLAVSF